MRRSTVLSLPFQLVFLAWYITFKQSSCYGIDHHVLDNYTGKQVSLAAMDV
jgi:hypothetical protein